MTSAAKLLDRWGVPPREVCLDWAWQLHDAFGSRVKGFERVSFAIVAAIGLGGPRCRQYGRAASEARRAGCSLRSVDRAVSCMGWTQSVACECN